jgi:hypothetical protein
MAGTGKIKYPGRIKTSTAALQFDFGLFRARGRKIDQKSPGPPGWRLIQQASPPAHRKKRIAKKPIGNNLNMPIYTYGVCIK